MLDLLGGAAVPMGTRSGDLDPAVLLFLETRHGYTPDRLRELVERESGLLGISGVSGDVRALLERAGSDPRAALALDVFCYAVTKQIRTFAAALGGLDTLVFTGGIGEHCAPVRERICAPLRFVGVQLEPAQNQRAAPIISPVDGSVCVRVHAAVELRGMLAECRSFAQPALGYEHVRLPNQGLPARS